MTPTREGRFAGARGSELFRRSWLPQGPPKGVVVLVHGLGDHSGLYAPVPARLVPAGHAIEACDLRGHGRSPGKRGHLDSWDERRADLLALLELVRSEHPGAPVFLLGHSAGGLTVLELALRHPEGLAGVVAASPAVGDVGVPAWLLVTARVLSRIWPSFSLDARLEIDNLSRDPDEVRAIVEDPLYHTRGTARTGAETLDAIAWTRAHARELRLPLLVLHGSADRLTSPDSSHAFFDAAGSADKTYRAYPGAFHNLFRETNTAEVLDDLVAWLDRQTE